MNGCFASFSQNTSIGSGRTIDAVDERIGLESTADLNDSFEESVLGLVPYERQIGERRASH